MLAEIEISFIGRLPKGAVLLRLQVGDSTHELKPKEGLRTANWSCGMYVSPVMPSNSHKLIICMQICFFEFSVITERSQSKERNSRPSHGTGA